MNILAKLIDKLKVKLKLVKYGNLILLIGQRGTGKSETIKTLCKSISGNKYIVRFDENLSPLPMHNDDKKTYENIPKCIVIENQKDIDWKPGLFVMEDFPSLSESAKRDLYNQIKDARHTQMNFIIVAHDYKVLKDSVFKHSNCILLYQDSVITPHQLKPKVGGLAQGHAIDRALNELPKYNYIFVSFDYKKWHNPSINSRKVDILSKAIRGNLNEHELSDISYPKKQKIQSNTKKQTKRADVISLLKDGKSYGEIRRKLDTSLDTIYKIKSQEKSKYKEKMGWNKNTPDNQYPSWLQDRR